jgi:hypothetical protein
MCITSYIHPNVTLPSAAHDVVHWSRLFNNLGVSFSSHIVCCDAPIMSVGGVVIMPATRASIVHAMKAVEVAMRRSSAQHKFLMLTYSGLGCRAEDDDTMEGAEGVFPSDYLSEGLITDGDISSWLAALPRHTTFACFTGYLGNVCMHVRPPAAFKGFICSAFEDVDATRTGNCGLIAGQAIDLLAGGDTDTAVFQAGLHRQLRRRRCCPTPLVVCTQPSVLQAWPLASFSSMQPPPLLSYSSPSSAQDTVSARGASLTPQEVSFVKQLLVPNAVVAISLVVMSQHFSRDLAEDVVIPIVALLSVNGRASSVTRKLASYLIFSSADDLQTCLGKGSVMARFLSLYVRMHCRAFVAQCLLPIIQMCSQIPPPDPSSVVAALGRILLERVYEFPSDVRGVLSSIPELCTLRGWQSPYIFLADILVSRVLAAALRVPIAAGLLPSAPEPQQAERLELVAFALRKFVGRIAGSSSSSSTAADATWRSFLDAVTTAPGPPPPPSSSSFTFGLSDQVQVIMIVGRDFSHTRTHSLTFLYQPPIFLHVSHGYFFLHFPPFHFIFVPQ